MTPDVRDRALGNALERAVHGLDPDTDRLRDVRRRGSRHRLVQLVTVTTAVVVFAVSIGYAAVTWGDRTPYPAARISWTRFGGSDAGWRIQYPTSWHLQTFDDHACTDGIARVRAFLSNVPFELRRPPRADRGPCYLGRWVRSGFPRSGVALAIDPVPGLAHLVGGIGSQPDTGFPLRVSDLLSAGGGGRTGPRVRYLIVWKGGDRVLAVHLYVGPGASSADRALAERALATLRLDVRDQVVPRLGTCPRATEVAAHSSPFSQGRPTVGGDDGQGHAQLAWVVDVPGYPESCSRLVIVQDLDGTRAAARLPEWWNPQLPVVERFAHIESETATDLVVTFDAGGEARQVAIYSMREGQLVELRLPEIFLVEDTPREAANVECDRRPGVIAWGTADRSPEGRTSILRRFYRLNGTHFELVPRWTKRYVFPRDDIGTIDIRGIAPELEKIEPFVTCP